MINEYIMIPDTDEFGKAIYRGAMKKEHYIKVYRDIVNQVNTGKFNIYKDTNYVAQICIKDKFQIIYRKDRRMKHLTAQEVKVVKRCYGHLVMNPLDTFHFEYYIKDTWKI